MDTFVIRPALAAARIHDPVTNDVLAAEGEEKPRVGFWLRCLARGDVEEVQAKAVEKDDPAAKKAKPKAAGPKPAPPAAAPVEDDTLPPEPAPAAEPTPGTSEPSAAPLA